MQLFKFQVDLRVALLYAVFGGLWILLSDRLLAALITDISLLTTMQTYKGWAYVVISALLIYFLLQRELSLRKKTEDKLRESEERYRLLFETSIDAFLLTAPDGSIHAANPAACRMFGWTEAEIKKIGRSGLVDRAASSLPDALKERASKGYFRGELTFVRKDGTKFPGEISSAIFTDNRGSERTSMIIRDITERAQSEENLRESEMRLKLALETAQMGVWEWNLANDITYTSPSLYKIIGIDSSETDFERFKSLIHPEDVDRVVQEVRQAIAENTLFISEFRMIRPDGRAIWVNNFGKVEHDENGKPFRMVGIIEDITLRVRAEDTLRLQSAALEAAANSIVITDRGGIIQWANPAFTKLTGFTLEEALGKNPRDLIRSGEQDQEFFKDMWDTILAGQVWRGELINRRKDGSHYTEEMTITPLKNAQGEVAHFIAIKQDISERVNVEHALHDSRARLSGIIDSAMDAIVTLDANQRIILFNPAAEKMFRCPADEALGQPLDRFIPERFREAHREHIHLFGQTNQSRRSMGTLGPLTCLRADGKEFPAEIAISQAKVADGKIYTAILRDITERKQAEEELHRRINELSALYQTTLDIISVQDLPDLLNTIVMRAVDLLDGTGGGLYLCEPEQKQVRCVVSYNTPDDYTGIVLAYGEGAAGTVAATGEPLIIDDYQTWEGRAKTFESAHPFSAVISVPMLWYGGVTGVIHVLHETQKHKFTKNELKLLTSFANQAAVVVENARLFEETQRRLERLSALRRIDQVITSSLDLRVTLNILLGQILQLLEVDAAAVLLYQPELHKLEFVAGQGFRTQTLQSTNLPLGKGFAGQAAKERRTVQVFDLEKLHTGFLRSPEFRNEEFLAYIGVPLIAKGSIVGVLEIYNRQQFVPDDEWMDFLETLAGQAAIAIDNINLFNNLEKSNLVLVQAYDATIEGWARALELRDMETEGHSRRVVDMTIELARKLGIEKSQLVHVRQGALLHDIGKMGVPDSILQKNGPLTDEEWETIHHHPVYANKWLAPISYLKPALDIPYCHHEKWDGSGYPRGLKGEQIPLAARIFAVVDVWDALRSDRPYREKWSRKKTREYILEQSGKHFDPKVVEAFLDMIDSE